MKRLLSFVSQTIVFLLTVALLNSVTMNPLADWKNADNAPISSSESNSPESPDSKDQEPNLIEEMNDDAMVFAHTAFMPSGYSFFNPLPHAPLFNHTRQPSLRPPRV